MDWYFDKSDCSVSVNVNGSVYAVCTVYDFDSKHNGLYYFGEKSIAHANLITSAPALLEALEELMELESRGRIMPIGKEWDKARSAIAAARGK